MRKKFRGAEDTRFFATSANVVSALNADLTGSPVMLVQPVTDPSKGAPALRQALADEVFPKLQASAITVSNAAPVAASQVAQSSRQSSSCVQ